MTNQLAEAKSQLGLKSGLKKERSASFVMSMATYDTKRDPPIDARNFSMAVRLVIPAVLNFSFR